MDDKLLGVFVFILTVSLIVGTSLAAPTVKSYYVDEAGNKISSVNTGDLYRAVVEIQNDGKTIKNASIIEDYEIKKFKNGSNKDEVVKFDYYNRYGDGRDINTTNKRINGSKDETFSTYLGDILPYQKILLGTNTLKALVPEFGRLANFTLYTNDIPIGSATSKDTIANKSANPKKTKAVAKDSSVKDPKVPMKNTGLQTIALALMVGLVSIGLINYREE